MTYSYIRNCYDKRVALGEAIHRKTMNLFKQYMLVGGMPQSVLKYVENKEFEECDWVKRQILELYRSDVTKFASGYESRVLV